MRSLRSSKEPRGQRKETQTEYEPRKLHNTMITTASTTTLAVLVIFFFLIASALVASSNGGERGDQHLRAENHAAITSATTNRAGRPRLLRADGQRNLFAESSPDIDPRTGRPRLLCTNGQRHLLLARGNMHESTTRRRRRLQDQAGEEEKSTLDSLKDTYDEVMAIDETPPEEWTSAQKWGVAIGVLADFIIVSCIWRCLCCK